VLATSGLAWFLWVALILAVDLLVIVLTMTVAGRKGRGPVLWGSVAVFVPLVALMVLMLIPPNRRLA
jgi:predicted transporter